MNITINTEVLQREGLSLADFLVLLMGFYGVAYKKSCKKLVDAGIIQQDVFNKDNIILSNNTKDYVSEILMKSNSKVTDSNIDFCQLAQKLQSIYPAHLKPGTTHDWRGKTTEIVQKLITLVAKHGFTFTIEEAIKATQEYVNSFNEDKTKMQLLKYFILRTDGKTGEINGTPEKVCGLCVDFCQPKQKKLSIYYAT